MEVENAPIHSARGVNQQFDEYENDQYDMAFAITRSQSNWTPMGDFGATCQTALCTTIIKHQIREYILEEWWSMPPVEHQRLGELKLFWQHMVAQHLTKTFYDSLFLFCFFFHLPPISFSMCFFFFFNDANRNLL